MNIFECCNGIISEPKQKAISQVVGFTTLSAICGYGGAFFFTHIHPLVSATYFASVALTSQVVYRAFEHLKSPIEKPVLNPPEKPTDSPEVPFKNHFVEAIQLLQIPLFFHLCHGVIGPRLHGAIKLELIVATAHFVAVPVFFHLAIKAWKDPSVTNVAAAAGVMLPLATGLLRYTTIYP